MKARSAKRSLLFRGGMARVMVVSACVLALLGVLNPIVGQTAEVDVQQDDDRIAVDEPLRQGEDIRVPEAEGGGQLDPALTFDGEPGNGGFNEDTLEPPGEEETKQQPTGYPGTEQRGPPPYPVPPVGVTGFPSTVGHGIDAAGVFEGGLPPRGKERRGAVTYSTAGSGQVILAASAKHPWWKRMFRRSAPQKVKGISKKKFESLMPVFQRKGICGMYPVQPQYILGDLGLPNGEWIVGNLAVALGTKMKVARRYRFLPQKIVRQCRTPPDLESGFVTQAATASGMNDPALKEGFRATVRAVIRYQLANVIKRPWMCFRRPSTKAQCDVHSAAYMSLLGPLRGFMCSKDLKRICARWNDEVALQAI